MMTGNTLINFRQSKAFLEPSPHRSKLQTTRSSSSQPETSTGIAPQPDSVVDHAGENVVECKARRARSSGRWV